MSNIQETVQWEPTIYEIAKTDAVVGGSPVVVGGQFTSGIANAPLQQLANRTQYLNQQVTSIAQSVGTMGSQITTLDQQSSALSQRVTALEGSISSFQSQISSLEQSQSATDDDIEAMSLQIATLESDYNTLVGDFDAALLRITALENAGPVPASLDMIEIANASFSVTNLTSGAYLWDQNSESKTIDVAAPNADDVKFDIYIQTPTSMYNINFEVPITYPEWVQTAHWFFNGIEVDKEFLRHWNLFQIQITPSLKSHQQLLGVCGLFVLITGRKPPVHTQQL